MKRLHEIALSLAVVLMLLSSGLIMLQTTADDQPAQRLTSFLEPSNVTFSGIAWKQTDYSYAIAVGVNTSSNKATAYRYEPNASPGKKWVHLFDGGTDEYFNDVVYDTNSNNDTFLIASDNGGKSDAVVVYNAHTNSPKAVWLGEHPPGSGYIGAAFDPDMGPTGTLICVGTPYTTKKGIVAWHNMSKNENIWSAIYTRKGEILESATVDPLSSQARVIVVGHNETTGKAVAYALDYEKLTKLSVPPDAKAFHSIDWYPGGKYAIVAGENTSGHGKIWRMSLYDDVHISYYNSTSGSESLKYAHYNGKSWHTYTIDSTQYAGYYTSMALDSSGFPHISYWEGGSTHLKYAYYNGSSWVREVVDSSGNVGQYSSIDMDKDDNVYISYYDTTNKDLKCAIESGGSWNITTVDSTGDVGKYSSIAVGFDGVVHISYYDATNKGLKYAWRDTSQTWHNQTVESATGSDDIGEYTSIALDPSNNPHISYYALTGGSGYLSYASYDGSSWQISRLACSGTYTSLAIDLHGTTYLSSINSGLQFLEHEKNDGWPCTNIDSSASDETSVALNWKDDPRMSYYSGGELKFAYYDGNAWNTEAVDSAGSVGRYSSLATGTKALYYELKGVSPEAPVMRGVDWADDGGGAVIVGDSGSVYVYYAGQFRVSNWRDPGISANLFGVSVKSPGSPGYALAVGPSKSVKISYQVYNTGTQVKGNAVNPHINHLEFEDRNMANRTNEQVDVGDYYYFFVNGSYANGWDKVAVDIYAWYDEGNESTTYNQTSGSNINLHLHYEPNSTDPYNNSGTWKLLWPDSSNPSITLGDCIQTVVDNPDAGTKGQNDGKDYYLLWANITFGRQVRYAPGDGNWTNSSDRTDSSQSFNDVKSWNFNITIRDRSNGNSTTKYDEFGIYSYTEISAENSPSGTGAPGSVLYLQPDSHVAIRSNRYYFVKVGIDDLKNATGARTITSDHVEVRNPDANNDTTISDICAWTAFPAGGGELYVWGRGTGTSGNLVAPTNYGTCSRGNDYGYDTSIIYTRIEWKLTIPPNTLEDTYISTITYEISY